MQTPNLMHTSNKFTYFSLNQFNNAEYYSLVSPSTKLLVFGSAGSAFPTIASCPSIGEGEVCGIIIGCNCDAKFCWCCGCCGDILYKAQSIGDGVRPGEFIGLQLLSH